MQHPSIFWAYTKELVYMRIQVNQAEDVKVDIYEKTFSFSCVSHGKQYECAFNLFKALDPAECKYKNLVQSVEVLLRKKEAEKEFWPSLYEGPKLPYVRVDFDRWIDPDEEEKPASSIPNMNDFGGANFGDFDPSQFKMPEKEDDDDDCKCGGDCKCGEHEGCCGKCEHHGECGGECGGECKCEGGCKCKEQNYSDEKQE